MTNKLRNIKYAKLFRELLLELMTYTYHKWCCLWHQTSVFSGIFAFFSKLLLMLQLYLYLGGIDVSWAEILLASLFKIIFPNVINFPFLFVLKTPELNWIISHTTQNTGLKTHQYILQELPSQSLLSYHFS